MTQESDHKSNDDSERSLEAEVAQASKDEPTTKIVATELGNVLLTSLQHLPNIYNKFFHLLKGR